MESKLADEKYTNNYYKCKGCKLSRCRISWRDYPNLFSKGKLAIIQEKYSHLNLTPKNYSSRCRKCSIGNSIEALEKKGGVVKKGKSLKELKAEFEILRQESEEVQNAKLYKKEDTIDEDDLVEVCDSTCDKKRIRELEEQIKQLQEQNNDSDDLIDEIQSLRETNNELENTVKTVYDMLYNKKEKLQKKQRECRQSKSVKISDYYDIKQMMESVVPNYTLLYQKHLDNHNYHLNPDDWESDCNSQG